MNAPAEEMAPLRTLVICNRELLIGAATAALLEDRGIARTTVIVTSIPQLLSRLDRTVELAVVFDGFEDEMVDFFEAMHHRSLGTPVLVVSSGHDADYAATVLESGAAGLLHAWCDPDELCESIRDIGRGHITVTQSQRAEILAALRASRIRHIAARQTLGQLTALDIRILRSLCDGMTVSRIADRLLLSPHTVRGRVRAIGAVIDAHGQLRIAAAGRQLLSAARLPPMVGAAPPGMRSGRGLVDSTS